MIRHFTLFLLIHAVCCPAIAQPTKTVHEIGSRHELFIDDELIERLSGKVDLRLQHPVPQEIAMEHNEPWEGSGCVYHSIFKDGDGYRKYYAAGHLDVTPNGVNAGTHGQFCCYAESEDGIPSRRRGRSKVPPMNFLFSLSKVTGRAPATCCDAIR